MASILPTKRAFGYEVKRFYFCLKNNSKKEGKWVKEMLKSCKYCGRIHDEKTVCPMKPQRKKKSGAIEKFRSSWVWKGKREEIKRRDNYICQICIRNLYDTERIINHKDTSVHHAIPMEEDSNRWLDDDNLLTVCSMHHSMAERGEIPRSEILEIIQEQQTKTPPDRQCLIK